MLRPAIRTLLIGTILGFLILGVGGRLAMAAIQIHGGGSFSFSIGGSLTVIGLGAVSGLAGAVLAILSRWVARRFTPTHDWTQFVLLGALLFLVTVRGLSGTAPIGRWYFFPLVAIYGVVLSALTSRRTL
jgi:hypothetical protein